MPSRFDDPNWWPTPPPQKATSGSKLVLGTIVPLLVIGGVVIAITLGRSHSEPKAATATAPVTTAPVVASASPQDRRQAFRECMQNAGSPTSGFGRFSQPSQKFRQAFEVCRSLIGGRRPPPTPQPQTATTPATAPVA